MNRPYVDRPEECKYCKYRYGEATISCNYILYTGKPRGCEVIGCNKFEKGTPSLRADKGCANCKWYESYDLFNGWCNKKEKATWDYRPSCEDFMEEL